MLTTLLAGLLSSFETKTKNNGNTRNYLYATKHCFTEFNIFS